MTYFELLVVVFSSIIHLNDDFCFHITIIDGLLIFRLDISRLACQNFGHKHTQEVALENRIMHFRVACRKFSFCCQWQLHFLVHDLINILILAFVMKILL
ncbi:Uncharacterized protein TCM_027600 [Theobroma cacao]|uniref:Uncharacterized protein n=1 Tax=Theobroma cacao TaxID=3641 RepID=A0A061G9W9_THECC|nr:Uncharacterized protein TCM_027600 [Theobroma cacao]